MQDHTFKNMWAAHIGLKGDAVLKKKKRHGAGVVVQSVGDLLAHTRSWVWASAPHKLVVVQHAYNLSAPEAEVAEHLKPFSAR